MQMQQVRVYCHNNLCLKECNIWLSNSYNITDSYTCPHCGSKTLKHTVFVSKEYIEKIKKEFFSKLKI